MDNQDADWKSLPSQIVRNIDRDVNVDRRRNEAQKGHNFENIRIGGSARTQLGDIVGNVEVKGNLIIGLS